MSAWDNVVPVRPVEEEPSPGYRRLLQTISKPPMTDFMVAGLSYQAWKDDRRLILETLARPAEGEA